MAAVTVAHVLSAILLLTISALALILSLRQTRHRQMHTPANPADFRAGIREKYARQFALHREVAERLEEVISARRQLPSHVHVALDMLMTQAYKTHLAVRLLAERAQAEDAATMTRRLMELGIQAVYIGCDDDVEVTASRAGCYLAWIWRSAPDELHRHVPEAARQEWQKLVDDYGPQLPKARRWGPSFRDMFEAAGLLDAYEQDYTLLSAIAHGSARDLALHYAMPIINLRSDMHVPALLIFASRYYLSVADAWNRHFTRIDPAVYNRLLDSVVELRDEELNLPAK